MNAGKEKSCFRMCEESQAKIVVIGVGGMGNNAVRNIGQAKIENLKLYAVNTDLQALKSCEGCEHIQIGGKRTGGRGAGGDPEIGRLSAEDDIDLLRELLEGSEIVFIAAGMGGGTGTGAAPVIARLAREMNILVIGTVTTPLVFEGPKRLARSDMGLAEMRRHVDSLVVIDNERLTYFLEKEDVSFMEAFRKADEVLIQGIKGITQIINMHGYVNLDLMDARAVLKRTDENDNSCEALIGLGEAEGDDRAVRAALAALENPLLANVTIEGAGNLLVNVIGCKTIGYKEAQSAIQTVAEKAGRQEKEIFIGIVTDDSMGEKMSVTVIATGFEPADNKRTQSAEIEMPTNGNHSEPDLLPDPPIMNHNRTERGRQSDDHFYSPAIIRDTDIPETITVFGKSPLVRRPEWSTPAFLRRGKSLPTTVP